MSAYQWYPNVLPKIINIFTLEGYSKIQKENIRVWESIDIPLRQIAVACDEVKDLPEKILIVGNVVERKEYFETKLGIKVYDVSDLKEFAIKYDDLDLYDML